MHDEFTIYTGHLPANNNCRETVSKFGNPYFYFNGTGYTMLPREH